MPATTRVPYSIICLAWNAPAEPTPWTTSRVSYPTRTLMSLRLLGGLDHLLRPVRHVGRGDDVELALGEHLLAELDVGALQPDHQRDLEANFLDRRDHALRD